MSGLNLSYGGASKWAGFLLLVGAGAGAYAAWKLHEKRRQQLEADARNARLQRDAAEAARDREKEKARDAERLRMEEHLRAQRAEVAMEQLKRQLAETQKRGGADSGKSEASGPKAQA